MFNKWLKSFMSIGSLMKRYCAASASNDRWILLVQGLDVVSWLISGSTVGREVM